MKYQLLVVGVTLCALITTGCTKDPDGAEVRVGKQVTMTMQAHTEGLPTRIGYTDNGTKMNFSWHSGDKLSVVISGVKTNDNCLLSTSEVGKRASFTGNVADFMGSKDIYAFYPYSTTAYTVTGGDAPTTATTSLTLSNPQLYTIGGAVSNSFMVGVGTATSEGRNINATAGMKQVMSILKLHIANAPGQVKSVKFSCNEAVLPTRATVQLHNATASNLSEMKEELGMVVKDTTNSRRKEISFAILPADLTGKKITIEVTFNDGTKDIQRSIVKDGENFMRNVHYIIDFDAPEEGVPAAPPTVEDLKAYFSIGSKQTVAQAIRLITEAVGEQTVNKKRIEVRRSSVTAREDNKGRLIVMVAGLINGKAFSHEYTFEGLVQKPANHDMALRAQVRWKSQFASMPEAIPIAFDELYRLKQTDQFTARYLSQWVEFSSSSPDGQSYIYTDEDIEKTRISEVKYSGNQITFVISYNSIQGVSTQKGRPALTFDRNEFYKRKVTLNREDIKQYYMQGVYENLETFYGNAIRIEDEDLFVARLVVDSKSFDPSRNLIGCQLSLVTRKGGTELAQFDFVFEGFKPLSDLGKEWLLATKTELNEYMQRYLKRVADGDVLKQVENLPISRWIKMAQMAISRKGSLLQLYAGKGVQDGTEVDAWVPVSHLAINSDILLLNPRFEVVSAQKKENRLYMQVALVFVNAVELRDVVVPLEVIL